MTGVLDRLAGWLVDPAPETAPAPVGRAVAPPSVALLAGPRDVRALGAALALRLTRGVAAIGVWTGEEPPVAAPVDGPALPAARRLARALRARELAAMASGRLVFASLPGPAEPSAVAARRLEATAEPLPTVLALAGPREAAWDAVLAERDAVLVHAADGGLAELAIERLAEQGVRAAPLRTVPGSAARALARVGLALPGALPALELEVAR